MVNVSTTKVIRKVGVLLLMVALSACTAPLSNPTSTPLSIAPAQTQPPPTTNPLPSEDGDCTLLSNGATTIYSLPSIEANVFSEVGAGFETVVTGRTADGWLGFNPGVAQAANIGPFRLRWIQLEDVSLSGDCVSVEELWGPQPGLCYTTQFDLLNVYHTPFPGSAIITILDSGDFTAVLGIVADEWAQLDLAPGNTGLDGLGWIDSSQLYLNGSCDLPTLSN